MIRRIKEFFFSTLLFLLWKFGSEHFMKLQLWYLRSLGLAIQGLPKYISYKVSFDGTDYSLISIGTGSVISSDVRFLTHDYSIMRAAYAVGKIPQNVFRIVKPIAVGKNCFIGAKSLLLPGVRIGDNVIVGAGSVVRGVIPDNNVIAGNPAKIICSIEEYYDKKMDQDRKYIRVEKINVSTNS